MIQITEYLSTKIAKPSIIRATDETIKQIVKDELDRLGYDADLNHIDVSEVTSMDSLFSCYDGDLGPKYKDLNPDISKWNVSNVQIMNYMFYECNKFDQDLSQWNVSKVKDMAYVFEYCKNFNQDISEWDVRNVIDMSGMFWGCENFNQDLSKWNVSNVESMNAMFRNCEKFNQDLSSWDVQKVLHSKRVLMFKDCPIREEFKPKFNI